MGSLTPELLVISLIATAAAILLASGIARGNFPLPPVERRLGCVDGLRGFLALSVLAHHFIIWTSIKRFGSAWVSPDPNIFNSFGAGAVALFFMTTGFLFYPKVLVGFRRTEWTALVIGRIFRLLPLVVASVATATLILASREAFHVSVRPVDYAVSALRWTFGFGEPPLLGVPDSGRINAYVLWSLGYEWAFYLFVLPFCALVRDLVAGRAPTWCLPLAFLSLTLAARPLSHFLPLIRYLPLFAIGMLAYEVQARPTLAVRLRSYTPAALAVLLLALGMTSSPWPYGPLQLLLYGIFFIVVASGNDLWGLLKSRGALILGECSFGIYLIHGIVLSVVFTELNIRSILLLPIVAMASVLISAGAHLVIERPGIRAGRIISRLIRYGPAGRIAPRLEIQ